jgi:signal transduction histidine kinase
MFLNLRLKLTIINASVIFLLFLFLITGTYYFSHLQMITRSREIAHKILTGVQAGRIHDLPVSFRELEGPPRRPELSGPLEAPGTIKPPGPRFFFVKTSATGEIAFSSSDQPLPLEKLTELVAAATARDSSQGSIAIEDNDYPYLKTTDTNQETIIIFQDFSQENAMLRIQATAFVIAGIICVILSFCGSFFMANRAMQPIKKAWKQQQDFLSDASHELRTPLTVIQTNLDVVLDNQMETVASQTKWLQNIREESDQMAKLVNSLLFLARADSNQHMLDKQPFLLDHAVGLAVSPFEALAALKDIAIQLNMEHPVECYGDEARLKQVIGILLDNAIRHTPAGGTISIGLTRTENKTLLTVTDSGEGIGDTDLARIFDRFYQVDQSRSKGGAGLGLAIAKWIVEHHNGTIQVTSTPGVLTTFTIQLP